MVGRCDSGHLVPVHRVPPEEVLHGHCNLSRREDTFNADVKHSLPSPWPTHAVKQECVRRRDFKDFKITGEA